MGCSTDFRCQGTPFKRLITGKKQPGGPGRSSEVRGRSGRKLEEVAKMEGDTPAKKQRMTTRSKTTTKPAASAMTGKGKGRGKGSQGRSK